MDSSDDDEYENSELDSDQETIIEEDDESEDDTIILSEPEENYANEATDENVVSKDGTEWSRKFFPKRQAASHDVIHNQAGLNSYSKHVDTKLDCFDILFNKEAENIVTEFSSLNGQSKARKLDPIDNEELRAFIGLLLITGKI